jgi:hypothetical protein
VVYTFMEDALKPFRKSKTVPPLSEPAPGFGD